MGKGGAMGCGGGGGGGQEVGWAGHGMLIGQAGEEVEARGEGGRRQ